MNQVIDSTQPTPENAPTSPAPQPAPQQAHKGGSGFAIAALVIGILAFMFSIIPILNLLAIPPAVVGLVLGIIGLVGAIKGTRSGKGLAIAGVVLNVLAFIVFFAMYAPSSDSADTTSDTAVTSSETSTDADKADDSEPKADSKDAAKEEKQDTSALAVGDVAKIKNGLEVSVDSTESITDTVGDSYLLISVTYTNNGKDKVNVDPYNWKATNGSGVETDSEWPFLDDDSALIPVEGASLNAGGTLSGKVALAQDAVSIHFYGNMFDDEPSATWNLQ